MMSTDPLGFVDSKAYTERLAAMREPNLVADALRLGRRTAEGRRVNICALEMQVHRRQHGRGGGREDHARDRALDRAQDAARSSSPRPAARACRKARSA